MDTLVKLLLDAMDNNKLLVVKNAFSDTPTWEELIVVRENIAKVRDIQWRFEKFAVTEDSSNDPELKKINGHNFFREFFNKNFKDRVWDSSQLIMSETKSSGIPNHKDAWPQIHWNCVGKSHWWITNFDGIESEVILDPGDIIFLPLEITHRVESEEFPRAGIIISFKN